MIDFPNSPTVGQTFTSGADTWKWDGAKWTAASTGGGPSGGVPEAPLDGQLYGRQSAAWTVVPTAGPGGGIPEAPTDGGTYGRKNSGWTPVLPLTGGTMTGNLILNGDPASNFQAATKAYVDSKVGAGPGAGFLPLTGGTMTGPIISVTGDTISGAAGTARSLFGASGTSNRWEMQLGGVLPESGSNSGSNFTLNSYSDSGSLLANAFQVIRANSTVLINGVGATGVSQAFTSGAANVVINKAGSGFQCGYNGTSNGVMRWQLQMGSALAESGGNIGSNFDIYNFSDTGALLGTAMQLHRQTGSMICNAVGATTYTGTFAVGEYNLLLNKAGSGRLLNITGANNGSFRWQLVLGNNVAESGGNNGSGLAIQRFSDGGAAIDLPFQIARASGVITVTQAIVVSSDERLKSDIEPVKGALDIIGKMEGVFFKRKGGEQRHVGLVAQNVAKALPEVVFEEEGAKTLGIAYGDLVGVLVNAIKELTAKVEALEAKP